MAPDRHSSERGFTLVEILVATVVLAVCIAATAPLFVYAAQQNAIGEDLGSAGALAVRHMERLRGTDYAALPIGGDLYSNVNGYFDDSDPEFIVRWVIVANVGAPASTKVITLRVESRRTVVGPPKQVTLRTLRGT